MAARTNRPNHNDKTREKIRTTQLKNRLEAYALGELDAQGNPIKMESGQVKAALGLMAKTLPDLTSADIHDSRQDQVKTYEEIRAELITKHGEPMALFMLQEITQGQLITMLQAQQVKEMGETDKESSESGNGDEIDVAPSHAQPTNSPDPGLTKPQ